MRPFLLLLLPLFLCTCAPRLTPADQSTAAAPTVASFLLGTYDDPGAHDPGIYRFTLNADGSLINEGRVAEASNPSFLSYNTDRTALLAVEELAGGGSVAAFGVTGDELQLLNRQSTSAPGPCHVNVSPEGFVTVATYGGGTLEMWKLLNDLSLSDRLDVRDHRQRGADTPHAHSSYYLNGGREVICADLGTDEVWHYTLDKRAETLQPASPPTLAMEPGAGPRHIAQHPNGEWLYVINELNSTVTQVAKAGSTLTVVDSWSTLPADYTGDNQCADIHVSSDGKYLYGSNRGHNSIVVYEIDRRSGTLSTLEHEPVMGDWPRNFALSPAENYLLVANQRSKNITTLARNGQTGMLDFVGSTTAPIPVCILF